jgi:hypothetical protein
MEGVLIFWHGDSVASKRTFTVSEVLMAAYGVKGEFSDFASTIDTEFVPDPYFSVISGRSKPFTIGMYRESPAGALMGRPGIGQSPAGLGIPPVQHAAAIDDH